jgi:DNA-binding response OmpR family regulator
MTNERTSLLFVDPADAGLYLPALRTRFEVTVVETEGQALRALRAFTPTLVVTELVLPEGDGVSICRQAKGFAAPPAVLALTSTPERVPDALAAGCDGVLVKPFAPNLLFVRIGLLLKQRAAARVPAGTNIARHTITCPACGRGGVVRFDVVSRDRAWYACVPCRKTWIGVSAEAGGASRIPDTGPARAAASC